MGGISDDMRGKIRNRAYASQIRDFSGLRFGKITPTDIDAFIEVGNEIFIFMESKHGYSPLPFGQKLALERLVDACFLAGKEAYLLLLSHDTKSDIDFAECPVVQCRYRRKWHATTEPMTAKQAIVKILEKSNSRQKTNI